MHSNNLHKNGYDFNQLVKTTPELKAFIISIKGRRPTIDFSNALAVKTLNQALLKHHYKLNYWDIPAGYLCPPVPGRADYIHHIADLLAATVPTSDTRHTITGLDIGVGANVIYPIVGSQIYGWDFIGSEVNATSLKSAQHIVKSNPHLEKRISIRQQANIEHIFTGIIQPQDNFSFTLCNPPFHANALEARAGSQRKNRNLARHKQKRTGSNRSENTVQDQLNFAGQQNELWCEGGEAAFIQKMITESKSFAKQVQWFTSLVSKHDSLKGIYQQLNLVGASEVKTVEMSQGSKISRFVAWRF